MKNVYVLTLSGTLLITFANAVIGTKVSSKQFMTLAAAFYLGKPLASVAITRTLPRTEWQIVVLLIILGIIQGIGEFGTFRSFQRDVYKSASLAWCFPVFMTIWAF